jgi:tRNA nucleotidyltransferase (CCA-adding enzyme)
VQIGPADELYERAMARPPIAAIVDEAGELQSDVYLVGGTVRDLILGRTFMDVDLTVDGDALKLATAIGEADGTESRFGTLRVERDGQRYDLARTRSEHYPHPGALPEVRAARIDADLTRRDFTVNALALGLTGSRAGELLAANAALDDLEKRQLAVLHDRSFIDDPTRLFRLARYTNRLGFEPAPRTRELATEAIANNALGTISGTRIGNELRLLANEPDPVAAFEAVADLGLPWTIDAPLARQALAALPADGRADLLVLACVLGQNEPLVDQLNDLGFSAADRDVIAEAATRSHELAERLSKATSRSDIALTVGSFGIETVALASSQGAPSQSQAWLQDLRHLTLDITGEDLIQQGIPEGPAVGRALATARAALMDDEATDRESQLRVALQAGE